MSLIRTKIDLKVIADCPTFRCDPRYYSREALDFDRQTREFEYFELGDYVPVPFVKGMQASYLDAPTDDSVPVVNTLSVQRLKINMDACRHMSREDFEDVDESKRLTHSDVLLTMDGGVSIGKPVLFEGEGDITADSHIYILRPVGIAPRSLVYLLASPIGQRQFRRAESGASGQTAVTEEDIRGFIFPASLLPQLDSVVEEIEAERRKIEGERQKLIIREAAAWTKLEALAQS